MDQRSDPETPPFPSTRAAALLRLRAFSPRASRYAASRNHVAPGHEGVSRLSAALRHRLLLEEEVVGHLMQVHSFEAVEKYLQEIHWRTYWKGWLECRPQVWHDYRDRVLEWRGNPRPRIAERVDALCRGESGVAILDRFTRELVETGYLHNHARMWWAGYWIHVEGLPWQLGADFFHRHLIDADAASNTLSWRWVAGIQTPGKAYLPRRSNLERYCSAELLEDPTGLERLEEGAVKEAQVEETASRTAHPLPVYPTHPRPPSGRFGFWLHEEDASLEVGIFRDWKPCAIAVTPPTEGVGVPFCGRQQEAHRLGALHDAAHRAAHHFGCPVHYLDPGSPAASVGTWAREHRVEEVVAYAPFVGPLGDLVPEFRGQLVSRGIRWTLVRRAWDAERFPHARTGFFSYWAKLGASLRQRDDAQPVSGAN